MSKSSGISIDEHGRRFIPGLRQTILRINFSDDLKCPQCGQDSLRYDNYHMLPTGPRGKPQEGETVLCNTPTCALYIESKVSGGLIRMLGLK